MARGSTIRFKYPRWLTPDDSEAVRAERDRLARDLASARAEIVGLERQLIAAGGKPGLFPLDPLREEEHMRAERDFWRGRTYRLARLLQRAMRPRVRPKGRLP